MKTPAKRAIIFLLITLIMVLGLTFSAQAMQTSKSKSGGKTPLGWCCENGKILHVSESFCQKQKGHFFKDKKAASAYCDLHQEGFCCLDGKISSMLKGNCLKKKGHFFVNKKAAATWCDLHTSGYCCLDGKVSSMLKGECLKKKGKFFSARNTALDTCDPLGWCLLKGTVSHARKSACQKKKGRFFVKRAEADRAARMAYAGTTAQKAKGAKKGAAPGIAPLSLTHKKNPFLTVERVYLKKVDGSYLVTVEIKNRGKGKLSPSDYNKGAVALQHGATHWHWPLFKVDKKGSLNLGKSVTYTTGGIIRGPTRVQISFTHVPGRGKSAVLVPPTEKLVKGAKRTAASSAATTLGHKPMRAGKKPLKPKPTMMARNVNPKASGHSGVPFLNDTHGISITSPSEGSYLMEATLTIHYTITTPDALAEDTPVVLTLLDANRPDFRIEIESHPFRSSEGAREFTWPLPRDLDTNGRYVIRGQAGDLWGLSDYFSVHFLNAQQYHRTGCTISLDPAYRRYIPGEEITVTVRNTINHIAPYYIYISPHGERLFGPSTGVIWHDSGSRRDYLTVNTETGEYQMRIRLPDDLNSEDRARNWELTAYVSSDILATSHYFTIGPVTGERLPPATWEILIPPPVSVTMGSHHVPLGWRIAGAYPEERNFTVTLLRGDEEVYTIPSTDARWNARAKSYQLTWNVPADLATGSNYRIRITETNTGVTKTSREFYISTHMHVRYDTSQPITVDNLMNISISGNDGPVNLILVSDGGVIVSTIKENLRRSSFDWTVGSECLGAQCVLTDVTVAKINAVGAGNVAIRVVSAANPGQYAQGPYFHIEQPYVRVWTDGNWCHGRRGRTVHWITNLDARHRIYFKKNAIRQEGRIGYSPIAAENIDDFQAAPRGDFCFAFGHHRIDCDYWGMIPSRHPSSVQVFVSARIYYHGLYDRRTIARSDSLPFPVPGRFFRWYLIHH